MTWLTPTVVDDVRMAFPAGVTEDLMPPIEECDEGLTKLPPQERKKWLDFQAHWFALGLPGDMEVELKDGIDGGEAFRHLHCIQGSYDPQHEHKVAAVAYLASLWFDDVKIPS